MKAKLPNQKCAGALLTDLYQLTMAYGYWKANKDDQEAVFELFFRKPPFQCGFTVAAGLAPVIDFLGGFCFTEDDVSFLGTLYGNDGHPLFERQFLDYLKALRFTGNVDAIPEGTAVFPQEPLLRIQGPILQCQLLETAMLNLINFQSLVATKAARVCLATQGEPVLEFGLRRAQGVDGALAASRAAHIGGCDATSNVLAGKLYGIPVRGTHAHSWVMSFDDELESFRAYAEAMPNNCVFLVDTYDTIQGVRHAMEIGRWLREHGHEMVGIRLDSGDLAWLSVEARKILDEGGFPKAQIVASNDLDENIIASLKDQGATINVWGVGTKLVTAYDQPALGGVYKLSAIRGKDGRWNYKVKLSEQSVKISNPGIHQVRRFRSEKEFIADGIFDVERGAPTNFTVVDPLDSTRRKHLPPETKFEDLLVPVFKHGQLVYQSPPLTEIRQRTQSQLGMFHSGVKRFVNPHQYPVGLELGLHDLKTELVLRARGEQ
ncbi:MAG TPA: nicotinate phosphoribosyltransferase [Candidatus Saccharimonadales bacterium]|nr:nicotinate phosphoribosyltransferase [Candidatus Saccharimonadales bacterium]